MNIAPIIHTRTFSCDFNSNFVVRPNDFLDSDVKWARKCVLSATNSIDSMNGERWLIADNGKFRIAGIVIVIKNLAEKINLSGDELKKAKELYYDEKGRVIYAFIGVVINNKSDYNKIHIDERVLLNIYCENIYPIWKKSFQETLLSNYTSYNEEFKKDSIEFNSTNVLGTKMFESSSSTDYKLFKQYLKEDVRSEFLFCTNLNDIANIKENKFSVISTSSNIIARLQREEDSKKSEKNLNNNSLAHQNNSRSNNLEAPNVYENNNKDNKKKNLILLMSALGILLVIIGILLL